MWVTKLLISQVKKKDFLPQNDQIWPKIGIFGQFGPGHAGLFNALLWVGWWLWRAGCISQDTYLLYLSYLAKKMCCRMFGTFEAERSDVKIVYGLVDQPQFWNPVWHQVSFFTLSIYTHENLFKTERSSCSESQRELLMYHPALLRCHPVSSAAYIFYSTKCRMHIINIKS